MRLLHIVPSFYPAHLYGGPIVSLHKLACAQVGLGLKVRVLTSDANGPGDRLVALSGRWVEDHGVPTYYARRLWGNDLSLEIGWRMPALLRWADLVHVTAVFSPTSMLALSLAAALRKPVVVSPRGSLLPWALGQRGRRKRLGLLGLRPLLRRVSGWHATSADEAAALRDLSCVGPWAAVAVIENGVDLSELPGPEPGPGDSRREVLGRLGIFLPDRFPDRFPTGARDGPVLTMLGRIDPVKGIDLAIAGLLALRRRYPGALLVLAGPDRDGHGAAVRAEAARQGVGEAVHLVGMVTGARKAELLSASDALWLCSHMESFGNVVLEALAAGTPVVAVHTTPWAWLEQTGPQGQKMLGRWVPRSPEALAEATAGLLALDQEQQKEHAQRRRAAVAARFSWEEIARRMSQLYAEALAGL